AVWEPPVLAAALEPVSRPHDCSNSLLDLLERPNLASNESKARHYDHEVKGLSVVRPFVGVLADVPAEATVFLVRHGSTRGLVLSEGVNPYLSDLDTREMAATVVDEAVRRQLAAGARLDRIAALDNFCWPDPVRSRSTPDGEYKLAQLVRACHGLYETCRAYRVPLISGKDSMKNESTMGGVKICVPPTLLVSALGQIDDVREAVTLDFKSPGDAIFLLGECGDHLGGSEYYRYLAENDGLQPRLGQPAPYLGGTPPSVDTRRFLALYRAFETAVRKGWVRSASTPTKGGLAVAIARATIAGDLGAHLDLAACPGAEELSSDTALFSESNGRFLVTVDEADTAAFEAGFEGVPCRRAGSVTEDPTLQISRGGTQLVELEVAHLRNRFRQGLSHD
ncbi:MAG: AIR synthase-related protein, partial [Acidobacteriota bacterium]|nr:AIR synthase-related protein [Acidobacteriota bacterium]